MKKSVLVLFINLTFFNCFAAETDQPHWTFEMGLSSFETEDKNWKDQSGRNQVLAAHFSFARRLLYVLDIGYAMSYTLNDGKQTNNSTYEILPIDIFLLLRARFSPNQWIVPYAGAGYTRFNYRHSIEGQDSTQGSENATHYRAGVQFLLDSFERSAARQMYVNYGVINSYLYFELKKIKAETGTPPVNIGGDSFTAGVMVEY